MAPRLADSTRAPDAGPGVKFFVVADPDTEGLARVLQDIYVLYCDYVLKNPFYVIEMPIHCERFDVGLAQLVEREAARQQPAAS